jgi:hypothetical protein
MTGFHASRSIFVRALPVSMLATTNIRINRLEDRFDVGFAAQDTGAGAGPSTLEATTGRGYVHRGCMRSHMIVWCAIVTWTTAY